MIVKYYTVVMDGLGVKNHMKFNKAKRQADRLQREFPQSSISVELRETQSTSLLGQWLLSGGQ